MEAAMDQVRSLHAKANSAEKRKIQEQLRDLQTDLSTDWEIFFGQAIGPLRWSVLQVGLDLNIFTTLASSLNPVTHQEFVNKTGAAPMLMKHLLQSMASFGFIQETAKSTYTANYLTKKFAIPDLAGAAPNITKLQAPTALAMPEYLKEHKYQDMTNIKDLPFHKGLNTDLEPFEYCKKHPDQMKSLGYIMVLDAVQSWTSSYPVEKEIADFKSSTDSALLVDIGGGFGQHSKFFKEKYPNLPGRVVVQDLPATLAHLPPSQPDGIEFVAHDFFTEQTIRGAKFYYFRHVLHDWPDDDCVRILKNTVPAMGPESVILIDEVILPETNVPWQCSAMAMSMMACLGGMERSREDWENLIDRAGLKISHVHMYDDVKFHGIVSLVRK
ncbi:S-adenosyl-L-methionine-dependent methyltransferase [Phaeosphaeriaceae sp. PMI808]|nr:S-adenosyl-L-methionine-dependent methyltransferase [Phaeosphaeriaceae sp. PMI808]